MYSVAGYGKMIADRGRMDAYTAAMRQVIRPGSVVLDIGCGTGIFSLLACRMGARRVYAVEPDDAIQVAKEIAADNGYDDRIVFIQDRSKRINLPEKADVMVSDMRGVLPLFEHHLPSIVDARERLLADDGVLIPQRDTLWAAVVQAPELYGRFFSGSEDGGHGFKMSVARKLVANTWGKARVEPAQLLVDPRCWATLDYRTITNVHANAELNWTIRRSGTASGLIVWFDSLLIDGVGMSNAPSAPELIYGSGFFPWPEPVALKEHDRIEVALKAQLVGADYIWRWDTTVIESGPADRIKAKFNQSTFFGAPLALETFHTRSENHVPQLDENGQLDAGILAAMDGSASLGEIARGVMTRFPGRFADWPTALAHVADLARRYSRKPESEKFSRRPSE